MVFVTLLALSVVKAVTCVSRSIFQLVASCSSNFAMLTAEWLPGKKTLQVTMLHSKTGSNVMGSEGNVAIICP